MRLASATATSIFGLRAIMRPSHVPSGAPFRAAHLTTATAPTISSRRMSRCPIFEVRPSRSLPPLECCRGVRPTQAAKSRPFEKVSIGGAKNAGLLAARILGAGDPAIQDNMADYQKQMAEEVEQKDKNLRDKLLGE